MPADSATTSEADARIGTVLKGKYRLDSVLGIGGMAVVYAATHRNQKRFAVKILHAELSVRADVCGRFLREGYIANTVGHPGAVAVLDDDVGADGGAFLVMELLDGAGLEELWDRHGHMVPVRSALAAGWQLLDVLAAAHAKTIVHRDIKPANLFVTRDGTLKVLDFGIARLRDAASEHATQSGTSIGTPAFMPPEQVMGRSSQIDALTDVWAVGATLFTLMSGHLVHEGESPQELMIRSATTPARSIASVMPALPPAIVTVIDRALAFDRAARWPDANAMREALAGAYRATFGEAVSTAPLAALLTARGGSLAPTMLTAPTNLGEQRGSARPPAAPRIAETVDATVAATRVGPTIHALAADRTVPATVLPAPFANVVGMTTSQPVSRAMPHPAASAPAYGPPPASALEPVAKRSQTVGVVLGVVALAVLGSGAFVAVLSTRTSARGEGSLPSASEYSLPSTPPSAAASLSGRDTAASSLTPYAADAAPSSGHAVAVGDLPAAARPDATQRSPTVTARPGANAPRPQPGIKLPETAAPPVVPVIPVAPAAPAPAAPQPNCDPPYTIDSAGHRILKRECLR